MDGKRFDDLSRRLASRQSRRRVLGLIGAATAGAFGHQATAAAPKKDKPTKCYGAGSHCTNGKQCCSAICTNRRCAPAVEPECSVASECAGIDTECQTRTCIDGTCGLAYTAFGVPVSEQTAGDCLANVCDGAGGVLPIADDTDLPAATNECVSVSCVDGALATTPLPAGTSCATGGGIVCNGAGQCGPCVPGATRACYSGPAGTEGTGICRAGTQTCRADGSGFDVCVGEVLPRPEQCNGFDDDCDGLVDEGIAGVGGPCTTEFPGVCAQGTLQCQDGGLRCVPQVYPGTRPEICNGLDDDCDGLVDEGAECPEPYVCTVGYRGPGCCVPPEVETPDGCMACCSGRCLPFPLVGICA